MRMMVDPRGRHFFPVPVGSRVCDMCTCVGDFFFFFFFNACNRVAIFGHLFSPFFTSAFSILKFFFYSLSQIKGDILQI